MTHHFEEERVTQEFSIKGSCLNEEALLFPAQKPVHDRDLVELAIQLQICGLQAEQVLR